MKASAVIIAEFVALSKELSKKKVLSVEAACGDDAPVFSIAGRTELMRFASSSARRALEAYIGYGGKFPAEVNLTAGAGDVIYEPHIFEEREMNGTSEFRWLAFAHEGRRVDTFASISFTPVPLDGPQPD